MYIYNYFIILLDVCVSYDTQYKKNKKSILNTIYDLRTTLATNIFINKCIFFKVCITKIGSLGHSLIRSLRYQLKSQQG